MKTSYPGPWTSRLALLVTLLLTVTLLTACGKKGPVLPRLASLPAAPTELRVTQQGEEFILSWTIPDRNQDGGPADDLVTMRVYRMVYNAADGCPTCRTPEELIADIRISRPEPAVRIGQRIYWRDTAPAAGTGHAYLITPVTIGGHEGVPASSFRPWLQPPPAPSAPRAEAGDRQVRLTWSPPSALPGGGVLLGYNLYRRQVKGVYAPVALNAEPLREPRLTDFVGEAGREAAYRVTSVVRNGDQLVESAPSEETLVTPLGGR